MSRLIQVAILALAAAPAFADTVPGVPEPDMLALIVIGAVALLAGRRGKK